MDDTYGPYVEKLASVLPETLQFPRMTQILDFLYLGNEQDAKNLKRLKDNGITHVLNLAQGYVRTSQAHYDKMKYLGIRAEDDDRYNIMQHFPAAYDFIEEARISGGKVLVHCIMGVNRSGAITVAYVMVHRQIGPISAASLVKEKRKSMLLSNHGFHWQLVKFADEKGLLHKDDNLLSKM